MKFVGFVSLPMKVWHQVLNFQEMSVPWFWADAVIVFICSVLLRGFPQGVRVPCAGQIGNLELIALHLVSDGKEKRKPLPVDDDALTMYVEDRGHRRQSVPTGCPPHNIN